MRSSLDTGSALLVSAPAAVNVMFPSWFTFVSYVTAARYDLAGRGGAAEEVRRSLAQGDPAPRAAMRRAARPMSEPRSGARQ